MPIDLSAIGFTPFFQASFAPHAARGLSAGRVALEHRGEYVLLAEAGELRAHVKGRLRHNATARAELPAVGDWVAMLPAPDAGHAVVEAVLPRRTALLRGVAGGAAEAQVVAANVDVVFVVSGMGADVNARRVERYLAVVRSSGAAPALVLTKADSAPPDAIEVARACLAEVAGGAPLHVISGVTGAGVGALEDMLDGRLTAALLGSSGAGKSTLVNCLAGASRAKAAPLGVSGKGQHTTTHRELVVLPGGGILLDTPGMRELRLWEDRGGIDETFVDVAAAASACRFRDCAHDGEPGCAVIRAIEDGTLEGDRFASYVKLEREVSSIAIRTDARAASNEKRRIKVMARALRARVRSKG